MLIVELEALAALAQLLGADLLGHLHQRLPLQHAVHRLVAQADHPAQLGQHMALQGPDGGAFSSGSSSWSMAW